MAYLNLLYHLKPLRTLSVDYLKLICNFFKSTILIIVLVITQVVMLIALYIP